MAENRSSDNTMPSFDVSTTTIPIAGLFVDVYGLEELPPRARITCLWLLHPRTYTRAQMRDIASRAISTWTKCSPALSKNRGLLALAFDMPNHGSRMVSDKGNNTWDQGNVNHAMDMLGMIKRANQDLSVLLDLIEGYLMRGPIERHISLGWSLGGHVSWGAWFSEQRIDAAVVILGCPNFVDLMGYRGSASSLEPIDSFVGSKYFPTKLQQACFSHDPKSILFGHLPVPTLPLSSEEQRRLCPILNRCIRGKKLLVCAGAEDTLVPLKVSQPLLDVLKDAVGATGWYSRNNVVIDERVYDGLGHELSDEMIQDVMDWLMVTVAEGPENASKKIAKL